MSAISLLVGYQVFTRYVLGNPSTWSAEATILLYPYATYIGAGLALITGRNLRITVFVDMLPPRWRLVSDTFSHGIAVVFVIVVFIKSIELMTILTLQFSPALNLPVWIFYFGITLGSFFICSALVLNIVNSFNNYFKSAKQDNQR
jgi:C4-dicarboxylate transporter DctQ subunit